MLIYLIWLVFIISVAMTAGGIILSTKLRNRFQQDVFSSLLYFQVFIFTFGFYGIWGQAVIRVFLSDYLTAEQLYRISGISLVLGLPFMVFAWFMLVRFLCSISARNCGKWFFPIFLLINLVMIVTLGYIVSKTGIERSSSLLKSYFISLNLLYTAAGSLMIVLPGKKKPIIPSYERRIIASSLLLIVIVQCIPLFFYRDQLLTGLGFILLFFTGNTFLPVYLSYGTVYSEAVSEPVKDMPLEDFCRKYEVSPRETDIIREICKGLSNKEISEKLFISLQTVKDHTHRIYIKTNVRSRVQLINLVKGA